MEQRAQEELLHLFRDAMKVGGAAIEMRLRRFASLVRPSDEDLALALSPLISGAGALRRGPTDLANPVDPDTKLSLIRIEAPNRARPRPYLVAHLRASVELILQEREAADRLAAAGLSPVRSLLMSGPPGVGKTMTAAWLAAQLDLPLLTLDLASVMSSFLGKTGANLRTVLNHAQERPCVLLLDEFDAIAKRRDDETDIGELKRLVTVILQTIDDWAPTSLLVAATNHGELLDPAVWRRFDMTLQFDFPDKMQRSALLQASGIKAALADAIASITEGKTLAALSRAIDTARKQVILKNRNFDEAVIDSTTSLTEEAASVTDTKARRDLNVLFLHAQGRSARDIADEIGASHTTVNRILKLHGGEAYAGA